VNAQSRRTVAIGWYQREDYARIKLLMEDGHVLPQNFDVWLVQAEAVVRIEKSRGSVVLKAIILPEPFAAWCRATNQRPNVNARTAHVNLAIEDYCSGYLSPAILESYEPV
jgi:hypothetical protein